MPKVPQDIVSYQSGKLAAVAGEQLVDDALVARAIATILADPGQKLDPRNIAEKLRISEFQAHQLLRSPSWVDAIENDLKHMVRGLLHRSLSRIEGILLDEKSSPSAVVAATRTLVAMYGELVDGAKKGHDALLAEQRTRAAIDRINRPRTA